MNNVLSFPVSVDYPDLESAVLQQAQAGASSACIEVQNLFDQTQYLPTLRSRVADVLKAINDANFKLRETAQSLDIQLSHNIRALRALQTELEGAPESEKEEIIEDITGRVAIIVDFVRRHHTALDNFVPAMVTPVDRTATARYLVQLEADRTRLPTDIEEIKQRQQALEEKRQSLTEAMALIEAKSFTDIAKDTALTADELVKLGMTPPELIAVEKAIELARQILERAENLINFLGLIEARNTVRKQIDTLIASAAEKTHELRLVTLKKDLIMAAYNFDDHRAQYTAEFSKFVCAKQSFLNAYRTVESDDQDVIAQFVIDAQALARHLNVFG